MKRIFTLTCLLFVFTTFAQRSSDFKVVLVSPANNQYIPVSTTFSLGVKIINQGSDTLRAGDSIKVEMIWNGYPMTFTNNNQTLPYVLRDGYTIVPGDSVTLSFQMAFANTTGTTSSFCVTASPYNTAQPISDPNPGDNESCVTIVHDVTSVPTMSDASPRVYPVPARNVLFFRGLSGTPAIAIYDGTGKLVRSQAVTTSGNNCSMDIHTLAPGYYYYSIGKGAEIVKGTFIKE